VCSAVPVSKLAISDDMSGSGGRIPGAINRSSPLLHPLLKDVCVPPAILLLGTDFEPRSGKAEALRPWDSITALQGGLLKPGILVFRLARHHKFLGDPPIANTYEMGVTTP